MGRFVVAESFAAFELCSPSASPPSHFPFSTVHKWQGRRMLLLSAARTKQTVKCNVWYFPTRCPLFPLLSSFSLDGVLCVFGGREGAYPRALMHGQSFTENLKPGKAVEKNKYFPNSIHSFLSICPFLLVLWSAALLSYIFAALQGPWWGRGWAKERRHVVREKLVSPRCCK